MLNIAIFGGTFNPFHIGHYEMLSSICSLEFIDKVLVMPDKIPPHKTLNNVVDDLHRQNMCKIVCEDFIKAEPCFIEFEREGKSYTIDTINLLRKKHPNDNFFVTIGGDMLSTLDTWYNWQELIKKVSFIAFKRDGIADFEKSYNRLIDLGADIKIIDDKITNISSTKLRNKISKEYLPPKIYDYIIEKGIYNG
ncbi:MAG: nicotinate (nicotinamide) nucleotide adenylyltransferase [Ruminococcaceae bacterium]|nr:nicotinate (nicotinamide) nucleotide adenylyltransferase [Oscillospiraceae bacterium]